MKDKTVTFPTTQISSVSTNKILNIKQVAVVPGQICEM